MKNGKKAPARGKKTITASSRITVRKVRGRIQQGAAAKSSDSSQSSAQSKDG